MNKIAAYYEILEEHPLWKTAMYRSSNPHAKSTELTDEEKSLARQQQLRLLGGTAAGGLAGAGFGSANRLKGGIIGAGLGALGSLAHAGATGGLYSKRLSDAHAKANKWERDNPASGPKYDRHTKEDGQFLRNYADQLNFDDGTHPFHETQEDREDYMDSVRERHIDEAYESLRKKTGRNLNRRDVSRLYHGYLK